MSRRIGHGRLHGSPRPHRRDGRPDATRTDSGRADPARGDSARFGGVRFDGARLDAAGGDVRRTDIDRGDVVRADVAHADAAPAEADAVRADTSAANGEASVAQPDPDRAELQRPEAIAHDVPQPSDEPAEVGLRPRVALLTDNAIDAVPASPQPSAARPAPLIAPEPDFDLPTDDRWVAEDRTEQSSPEGRDRRPGEAGDRNVDRSFTSDGTDREAGRWPAEGTEAPPGSDAGHSTSTPSPSQNQAASPHSRHHHRHGHADGVDRADAPAPGPGITDTTRADAPPDQSEAGHSGCTTPQLRRFIKSRAYVPMHELRRRFSINGPEDDVTQVETEGGRVFIGLPEREGRMIGDLLRQGEIGFELSLDPSTPVVVGVYPMRPVIRT